MDGVGDVFVADWENDRIQKFTSSGTFLEKWSSWGLGDTTRIIYPVDVAVDAAGNLYVVKPHEVMKFAQVPPRVTFINPNTATTNSSFKLDVTGDHFMTGARVAIQGGSGGTAPIEATAEWVGSN